MARLAGNYTREARRRALADMLADMPAATWIQGATPVMCARC
jgi:hypothetical protein